MVDFDVMRLVYDVGVVVGPLILGAAAGRLMFYVFDVVFRVTPRQRILRNVGYVMAWFLGNGALVIPILKIAAAGDRPDRPYAEPTIALFYMVGLGATMLYCASRKEPPWVRDLRAQMTDDEIDALLFVLGLGLTVEETARRLDIDVPEAEIAYWSALKKIKERHPAILETIKEKKAIPRR